MLFDRLCGIIEHQLPQYRKLLEQVHLFHFDAIPHEFLPKRGDISDDARHEAEDYFILPFDTVSVEDKASCVIISPVQKGIVGIWQEWYCLEITDLKNNDGKAHRPNPSNELKDIQGRITEDAYTISEGRVTVMKPESSDKDYKISSEPSKYYYGNKDHIADEAYTNRAGFSANMIMQALATDISNNTITCLEELMLLNSKDRFIVEKRPNKPKLGGKQLPRAHQRSTYTVLTIGEIHAALDKDPVVRQARAALTEPHYRRRHRRFLHNEKYKRNDDGSVKHVIIDPIWVGASEAKVGQHTYKVRLDL